MRGFLDGDELDFSEEALHVLSKASSEASYLIDHAYPRDTVMAFVGNRYQFTQRQRLFLARSVSGDVAAASRQRKRLPLEELQGAKVLIDGFNAIITLEVALSGSPVIRCQDGTVRDMAGLKGTYHIIDQTSPAIDLLLDELAGHGAAEAEFLLDAPVSNSGMLRELIIERSTHRRSPLRVEARTIDDVDGFLDGEDHVVTSDSVVLDRCRSWFDLDAGIVDRLADAWVLSPTFEDVATAEDGM